MIDQVKREVMIMKSIKHENLIELVTYFEDNRSIFLVMFLAEEDNLYKRLKKKKRYPEKEAAEVKRQKLFFKRIKILDWKVLGSY